jgi:hypothetical protein
MVNLNNQIIKRQINRVIKEKEILPCMEMMLMDHER